MNKLQTSQIALGNIFIGTNYRGEEVTRRLVGGTYGTVTKYFLIDLEGNLKSRKRDTIEEVLDGFDIKGVKVVNDYDSYAGVTTLDTSDVEVLDLIIVKNEDRDKLVRQIVGGTAYGETIYFAIDLNTGKRVSRTRETIQDVLNGYEEVIAVIKPLDI